MSEIEFITYDRRKLYEEVWAEPVREVAKRYGVSDVALAKTCRRLSVPLPGRGYWAKQRAGRGPKRPPLPALGGADRVVSQRQTRRVRVLARDEVDVPTIAVPKALRHPHPLVADALEAMGRDSSRSSISSGSWRGKIDVKVTGGNLKRALRIMDALLKYLEKTGVPVRVAQVPPYEYGSSNDRIWATQARCSGEWVSFALRERQRRISVPPPSWATPGGIFDHPTTELEPNGLLELSLTSYRLSGLRKVWSDGKRQRLEDCLGSVVIGLQAAGEHLKALRAEDLRRDLAYEEQRRRRQRQIERQRREKARIERLLSWVAQWRQAEDIRAFVREALARIDDDDVDPTRHDLLRNELRRAQEYADQIDPLRQ